MLSFIFAVILLLLAVGTVILRKTYYFVPINELQRQARAGDPLARSLYLVVSYGSSLRTVLWLVIGLSSAGGFVLLAQVAPAWMGFFLIAVLLWLTFSWLPNTRVTSFGARLATTLSPAIARVLNVVHPLLATADRLTARYATNHTGLFERDDLLALLDRQSQQPDSRITAEELDLVKHVLSFGDYKVRDSLRPRAVVRSVVMSDPIGPILLDELHASGQTSFPVKKTNRSPAIVGTLQLRDVGIHSSGTVQDYMTQGVTYIHEADTLADALHIFYQTKRQLFVVVNSFEEYVGVITLQDILHQLVGRPEANETLGSHDDLAVVAARHPGPLVSAGDAALTPPIAAAELAVAVETNDEIADGVPPNLDKTTNPVSETDKSVLE